MRIGIFDHVDQSGGPLGQFYADRLDLVAEYDRLGFHSYHVAEHHATPLGAAPSPSVYLAAAIQRTSRLLLGPLVYTLPLYHPLRLIDEICMLDQMSNGRLQLGIGRGISPIEVGYFGIDPALGPDIYAEALQVILRGLATDRLSFAGQHYNFQNVPIALTPVQKPHPPLWYGLGRPEAVPWAADHAVNIVGNLPAAGMRTITDRYRAEWSARGHGPETLPKMAVSRHVVIAETEAEALAIARPAYLKWRESFLVLWLQNNQLPSPQAIFPETFDLAAAQGRAVAGTAAQVHEFLQRTVNEGGLNYLLARFMFGSMPVAAAIHSARIFAAEIMPHLGEAPHLGEVGAGA